MVIEKIQINSDVEDGNIITVTGRSLESILDRRIIWGQKTLSGNLQNGIKALLDENVISPSKENRKIDRFVFEESSDTTITEMTIEAQYTGDNLYDVICDICSDRGIGFKVTLNDENKFAFKLYAGVDRSYDQEKVPYVIFSPKYDNMLSSNYLESKSALKNVTLVGGEGEGSARRYTAVGNSAGLDRREMFTDARDISSDVDGKKLSDSEYISQLRQRGSEDLSEYMDIVSFEGQAETSQLFVYGKDFFTGDIVQIVDEYGHEAKSRVIEMVVSDNEEGYSAYPTFSVMAVESKNDANTLLLLHGEDFSDSSMYNNAVTNTKAVIDSSIVKFGKSFKFSSASTYLRSSLPIRLSSHDFTVEWWEYKLSNVNDSELIMFGGSSYGIIHFGNVVNGKSTWYASSNGSSWNIASARPMGTALLNQWVHRAFVRSGSTFYAFENGVLTDTLTFAGAIYLNGDIVQVSRNAFNAYVDEVRISSVARWTKDFTPPSSPYGS